MHHKLAYYASLIKELKISISTVNYQMPYTRLSGEALTRQKQWCDIKPTSFSCLQTVNSVVAQWCYKNTKSYVSLALNTRLYASQMKISGNSCMLLKESMLITNLNFSLLIKLRTGITISDDKNLDSMGKDLVSQSNWKKGTFDHIYFMVWV